MLGRDASLLLPWQQDIAMMDRALLEFVSTEFDEDSRSMQHAALLKSKRANYHFCDVCHKPQYVHGAAACAVESDEDSTGIARKVPPCPHCCPHKYEVTCANPDCRAKLYVTHGCTTLRCCGHGEHCGHSRMVEDEDAGLHVASPRPCAHMGGCGFVFQMHPKAEHVADLGIQLDTKTLRAVLRKLDDTPNALLVAEYYTRHTLGCTCPACLQQPTPPAAFANLKRRQLSALYDAEDDAQDD